MPLALPDRLRVHHEAPDRVRRRVIPATTIAASARQPRCSLRSRPSVRVPVPGALRKNRVDHEGLLRVQALNGATIGPSRRALRRADRPNGSGKTTRFNVLTGYDGAPNRRPGWVRRNTRSRPRARQGLRRGIGRDLPAHQIFPRLTLARTCSSRRSQDSCRVPYSPGSARTPGPSTAGTT